VPDEAKSDPPRPADFYVLGSNAAKLCVEPNVFRAARQIRDEWRRQRYARLNWLLVRHIG